MLDSIGLSSLSIRNVGNLPSQHIILIAASLSGGLLLFCPLNPIEIHFYAIEYCFPGKKNIIYINV